MSRLDRPFGLVLAGGLGRRLGRAKGTLCFEDRSLARRAAETLQPLCRAVLISVRPGADNPAPGFVAIEDEPPAGRGPLAGILRAFEQTAGGDLLVLACDYPRVTGKLLGQLVGRGGKADVVLPCDPRGRDHPLVALWSRSMLEPLRQAVEAGQLSVRGLLARCRALRIEAADLPGIDAGRALTNVNTPEDLERLESS